MNRKFLLLGVIAITFFCLSMNAAEKNFWLNLSGQNINVENVEKHFTSWFSMPESAELVKIKDYHDFNGMRHVHYLQYVNGIKVNNGIVKVHSKDGIVTTVNGYLMEKKSTVPTLAIAKAKSNVNNSIMKSNSIENMELTEDSNGEYHLTYINVEDGYRKYIDTETGVAIKSLPVASSATVAAKGLSLYDGVVEFNTSLRNSNYFLVDEERNITTVDMSEASDTTGYNSGNVHDTSNVFDLKKYFEEACPPYENSSTYWTGKQVDSVELASVSGLDQYDEVYIKVYHSGPDIYSKRIYVNQLPLKICLGDSIVYADDAKLMICKYNYSGDDISLDTISLDENPTSWLGKNSTGKVSYINGKSKSISCHWAFTKAYDYFYNHFGRKGIDDKGSMIYALTNGNFPGFLQPLMEIDNAAFVKDSSYPYFYIGASSKRRYLAAPDIIAHEYTHGVTYNTAGLEYQGESGAIDEAFADIFGWFVKKEIRKSKSSWTIGEDVTISEPCLRSFIAPEIGITAQPSYYQGEYWADTSLLTEDHGGVHKNSGVINKWFYLFMTKAGLVEFEDDLNLAAKIMYTSLTEYLLPNSNFADVRQATLIAVDAYKDDFFFIPDVDSIIASCWDSVGVTSSIPTSITEVGVENTTANFRRGIYNMQGMRLCDDKASLKPGLYIIDGKKVSLK